MRTAPIRTLCVYCGSRTGENPAYKAAAEQLGDAMVARGIGLVYGAGSIGLMGIVARRVISKGGRVTGIIPGHLDKAEIAQTGLTAIHVVDTMHERKMMMAEMSDGFVILPGGLGTLDEAMEIITWAQLGLHSKPVWILNADGYWTPLITLIEHVVAEGFAGENTWDLFRAVDGVDALLADVDRLGTPAPVPAE